MAELVIIVPVLQRPANVAPLLESIFNATQVDHRVLFMFTPGDDAEISELEKHAGGNAQQTVDLAAISLPPMTGDYARKINRGYLITTEPLIFTGADDLRFHSAWFEAALEKLEPTVGVVGTNDLGNPRVMIGAHSTHSLVRREYANMGTIDEPNRIYHEAYPHEFCDDEMVQTARARRAFVPALNSVVEHLHPHWGKAPTDPLYDRALDRLEVGRAIYLSRQRLWQRVIPTFR